MIKKICALLITCVVPALHAEISCAWLEIKPGYFFFTNQTLRKIYNGGFEIQGSVSYPLYKMIALYGSLGYFKVNGRSLGGNQKTSISQVPVDLGLRAVADLDKCIKGYLSIGPRYFYFHQHNDSIYVNRDIRRSGLGFFINGGFNFIKNDGFLLGVFGEYAFERLSFNCCTIPNIYGRQNVQVGGFTFGASIGFAF
jgi:hypothetical protein